MRTRETRGVLAGLLCLVLLLASCATSQKVTNSTEEAWVSENGSPVPERATEHPPEAWTYYETYYGKKAAERILQKETGPDQVQVVHPQEAESEKPDEKTTLGDVAVGALKVAGKALLVIILVALTLAGGGRRGVVLGLPQ